MTWARLTILVCAAEVLTMAPFATFAALLPSLAAHWDLTATEAGWISGIYYVGYVLAVPLLVGLTDRVDARGIHLAGSALAVAGALGFALAADGFWSALVWRAVAGAALAGTYMPGMRILTDRTPPETHARVIPWYTASFGIGGSLSYWIAGAMAESLGWRAAFAASGAVALGALAVVIGARPRARDTSAIRSICGRRFATAPP